MEETTIRARIASQDINSGEVVQCKLLHPRAKLPERKNPGDVGYDLAVCEPIDLEPGEIASYATGIALQVPPGMYAQIFPRSGLTEQGIQALAGTIDNGYRGEIKVTLINHSDTSSFRAPMLTRVAQIVFLNYSTPKIQEGQLDKTLRGDKGYGSTGIHLTQVRQWRSHQGTVRRIPVFLRQELQLAGFEDTYIEIPVPNRPNLYFEPSEEYENVEIDPVICHDEQPYIYTRIYNQNLSSKIFSQGDLIGHFTPFMDKAYPDIFEVAIKKAEEKENERRRQSKGKGLMVNKPTLLPISEHSSHWRKRSSSQHF